MLRLSCGEKCRLATNADLKADLAALELRLVKWMIGVVFAGAGLVIAALRLIG